MGEFEEVGQPVGTDEVGLLDAGQVLTPGGGPGDDTHGALGALDEPEKVGLDGTGRFVLGRP